MPRPAFGNPIQSRGPRSGGAGHALSNLPPRSHPRKLCARSTEPDGAIPDSIPGGILRIEFGTNPRPLWSGTPFPQGGVEETTKRVTSRAVGASARLTAGLSLLTPVWRHPWTKLRTLFRRPRPTPPAFLLRQSAAPSVVLACELCGFDYSVTRIEMDDGKVAIVWTCSCGSRFIPPGGVPISQLVRP